MDDLPTLDAPAPPGELLLDPFGYHPGMASAIEGLGGTERHPDPTYAFHTEYVQVAEGPCHFTVRFDGLASKVGTLQLRVHMFVDTDTPRLLLANTVRTQFNRLIHNNSETFVRFDGFRGVKFALHGAVLGQSDARATGLSIRLDRPAGAAPLDDVPVAELRNTEFGQDAIRAEPALITLAPPVFGTPVCQAGTAPQLREPAFREWARLPGLERGDDRARWSTAYVLQALRTYGMLVPGAAGIGFADDPGPVVRAMEGMEVRCEAAPPPAEADALPGGLVNFDFLWTMDLLGRQGAGEAARMAEALMRCLRPGGVAVHILPFLPGLDQRVPDEAEAVGLRRGEVERLALVMISRRFETAQIRLDHRRAILGPGPAGSADVAAFGMVFRKPPLASD